MPNPGKGESKKAFIARYMGDSEAMKDYPKQKQRLAIAYSKWEKMHGMDKAEMAYSRKRKELVSRKKNA